MQSTVRMPFRNVPDKGIVKQVLRNLRSGVLLGLAVAIGLSLWALLVRIVGGTKPFELTTFSYAQTVLVYFIGFTISGALLGLLLPLRRWAIGSMLIGTLFTLPVYAAFAMMFAKASAVRSSWLGPSVLIAALLVGGGLGLWVWSNEYRGRKDRPHDS
jgi:hypothetical protein